MIPSRRCGGALLFYVLMAGCSAQPSGGTPDTGTSDGGVSDGGTTDGGTPDGGTADGGGHLLGVNLGWLAPWDPTLIFADASKHGMWEAAGGGQARLGTDGWPIADARIGALNDADVDLGVTAGVYEIRFTGRATVTPSAGTIHYPVNQGSQGWDSSTNITALELDLPEGQNLFLDLTSTRRLPGDTTATGITNLTVMRPGLPLDVGTMETRFTPTFLGAIAIFDVLRAMQTMGGGSGVMQNDEVYWSDADSSDPVWQPSHAYAVGDLVKNNGRVYRCAQAGTSAVSGGPTADSEWGGAGGTIGDGTARWYRAARTLPTTTGYSAKGPAWEDLILLANKTHKALWINVPFRVTDLYLHKLARALRFGTDAGGEPYSAEEALPVWPPLDPGIPIYLEYSNELWNLGNGYQGNEVEATADAEAAGADPHHLNDGNPIAPWGAKERLIAFYAVRASLIFREVWGDAAMGTTIRPVVDMQLGYVSSDLTSPWVPVWHVLDYIDKSWGPSSTYATIAGLANPKQPVSYYLYALAGAPYLRTEGVTLAGDGSASDVDLLFEAFATSLAASKEDIDYFKHRAHEHGIKFACYEGGTEVSVTSNATFTAAWSDPRMRQFLVDLTEYVWADTPPAGSQYVYGPDVVDVYVHFMLVGDGTFGLSDNLDVTNTQRWQAMQQLAAE